MVSIVAFICKTHVSFDRNRNMLSHLYWKEIGPDPAKTEPDDTASQPLLTEEQTAMQAKLVDGREPFDYHYPPFFVMYIWERICCCIKKDSKAARHYRMYIEARDRLAEELDIFNFIQRNRINAFVSKALLKKKHRKTVWAISKATTLSEEDFGD